MSMFGTEGDSAPLGRYSVAASLARLPATSAMSPSREVLHPDAVRAVVAASLRSHDAFIGNRAVSAADLLCLSSPSPRLLMYERVDQTKSILAASLALEQQRKRQAEEMSLYSLALRQRLLAANTNSALPIRIPNDATVRRVVPLESTVGRAFMPGGTNLDLLMPTPAAPVVPKPSPQEAKKILKALGSRVRTKSSTYVDATLITDPGADVIVRGGRNEYFPEKLYAMLEQTERDGQTDIVSWLSHGRAWKIHDQGRFVNEIMPVYFTGLSKYTSFRRQLNLWGFGRLHSGQDRGCLYHELFLRGREGLIRYMRRVGVPSSSKAGESSSNQRNQEEAAYDPDLRTMRPLP